MFRFRFLTWFLGALSIGPGYSVAGTITYSVTDLSTPVGSGGTVSSNASAINDLGQIAGSWTNISVSQGFLWDNGSITNLGDVGIFNNQFGANGINANSQIVAGGTSFGGSSRGFRWDPTNGLVTDSTGVASDINDAGQTIYHAGANTILAHNGNTTIIGLRGAQLNNNGDLVGTVAGSPGGVEVWNNGVQTALGFNASNVLGLNDNRDVVAVLGSESFVWSNGTSTVINPVGSPAFFARDINDSRLVVGFNATGAAVWDATHGVQDLNSLVDASGTGWDLRAANAINDSGQIVGFGRNPDGFSRGFLLTPSFASVPEPSGFLVLAWTSLAGLLRRRRKRTS